VAADGLQTLSRREAELLPLLARGMTLREASEKMSVSYKTADSYRTSLLRKLGVRDRVELARLAIRERIIDP
jgi:DNA-binding NarL/FixJ family response regulator